MYTTTALIELLEPSEVYKMLCHDATDVTDIYAWWYLFSEETLDNLLDTAGKKTNWHAIIDYKMTERAARAQARHPNLRTAAWSSNRTMHDKTMILPNRRVAYLMTHNMTHGSFWLSQNRCLRIQSYNLVSHLKAQWQEEFKRCKPTRTQTQPERKNP